MSALLSHTLPIWQIAIGAEVIAIKASLDDDRHVSMYMAYDGAEEEHVRSGEANQQGQQTLCARQGSDNDK